LNVSAQTAEQISGAPESVGPGTAVPSAPDAGSEPVAAAVQETVQEAAHQANAVESPGLVPEQGLAVETSGMDAPEANEFKSEEPKFDGSKMDAPKAGAATSGKIMIMSSGDRTWDSDRAWGSDRADPKAESTQGSGVLGKRRLSALAAVIALAAVAGALGGALATAGLGHFVSGGAAPTDNGALETTVARIDADIQALKASIDHTSKMAIGQFNRTNDRLDKVEKAQAEPAAKLAKLSEAVDKLRPAAPAAPAPAAAAPVAPKEVTGSVSPPAPAAPAAPKPEVGRLPTVEGWSLRDVDHGGALIEGRGGLYEVYPGDPVPGLGRIDAIRRQDGRWVVVTGKGLIVGR
jgi:hypothetical protein